MSEQQLKLKKVAKWTHLRAIGNSRLAKLSTLFPLVGYFVIFSDHLSSLLQPYSINGVLPFNFQWSIKFIYFGLCFTGIASAIYAIFCPEVIKSFSTADRYFKERGEFHSTPENLRTILDRSKYDGAYFNVYNGIITSGGTLSGEHFHTLADVFSRDYEELDESNFTARACVAYAFFYWIFAPFSSKRNDVPHNFN